MDYLQPALDPALFVNALRGQAPLPKADDPQALVSALNQMPSKNLMEQAQDQYPVLKRDDIQYKFSPNNNEPTNMLESWQPGEPGVPDRPRPKEFDPDKLGVEVFKPTTRPIDILGDVVSHHLANVDPTIKNIYEGFSKSLEPWQHERLQEQYIHAKSSEGEKRSFDDWKKSSGIPAYFRGYPFQQWDNAKGMYTDDQIRQLDGMMDYLRGGKK